MICLFGAMASTLFHLGWLASSGLLAGAVLIVLAANSLRATALFFPEAGLIHLPGWCHEGTGLLLYCLGMALLVAMARRLRSSRLAVS